jgi:hypothetical protein
MDHKAASCISYVRVGMLNGHEDSEIFLLTVATLGIATLTLQC